MKKINTKMSKSVKPGYVVDATWCEDVDDFKTAIILAKAGHVIITDEELAFLINYSMNTAMEMSNIVEKALGTVKEIFSIPEEWYTRKLPWYKRFWRWITRKK